MPLQATPVLFLPAKVVHPCSLLEMQLTKKKKTQLFLGSFIRQRHENKSLVGSMTIQTSNCRELILQLDTHDICKKNKTTALESDLV